MKKTPLHGTVTCALVHAPLVSPNTSHYKNFFYFEKIKCLIHLAAFNLRIANGSLIEF